jgi:hypothetical protein
MLVASILFLQMIMCFIIASIAINLINQWPMLSNFFVCNLQIFVRSCMFVRQGLKSLPGTNILSYLKKTKNFAPSTELITMFFKELSKHAT